ncbi:hypothetical protein CN155_04705 [Sinorhizobium meliloti]|uniref:hypothetical protein n=1 Tax=Rhizobium meliloti TaxID=382 RepID=UPI000FDBEA42|nr:hypothetical protein [Sinorhizobium meliloti]RVK60564.1 hypothetical protein CN155_04705 [Sinorhizobium meliloti]
MSNPKDDKKADKPTPIRKGVPPEMEFEPVPLPDEPPETGTAGGRTRRDEPETGEKSDDET